MNELIAKIYGAGGGRPARPQQARDPDWAAGASGDTVGGIGNTAAMGEDISWGAPESSGTRVGQVVSTPAGKYKVVETEDGFGLEPMEGALRGVSPTITNFTSAGHHLGINPETGEVWYQQAKSIPSVFSQGLAAELAGETGATGVQGLSGASGTPTNNFSAASVRKLKTPRAALPNLVQPRRPTNADYVKMVNEVMINSLFKDMI